ncbi:MAG: amidohydrolase [Candidatus Bipolaricaulota bacterium]|nr:MAG: amidohydrolase [Candidatus Bipolaricaulota bacterium]
MLAIVGGTVLTPMQRLEDGVVLVEDGKIVEVGVGLEVPSDAERMDASGKVVFPGLIDAHCHTGVFPDGIGLQDSDGNEMTDPITPHLRAIDAIHPGDQAFEDLREAGVTTINTGPGSANLIGGQTAVIKTAGRSVEEMLVLAPAGMKMALGENPKRVYGESKKTPSTRMGNAGLLREWLVKARNYAEKRADHERKQAEFEAGGEDAKRPDPFAIDLRLEELSRVLARELPAHIHAHRADDILTALRIAEEFDLDLVLIHATEGYKVADILAERGTPCIVGPILFSRMKVELRDMTPRNPGLLSRAGVTVAIQTDGMSSVRYLAIDAALAVQQGLDEDEALRAVTLTPAEILRVSDRVGSLEEGKDADLVIASSHPFDIAGCRVEHVLIDGRPVFPA